ncbi:ISH6 family transposase [Halonotius pteroides]|uniref:ISH6 family transposase n=1 Tax=Halonotius pteroides TaxID=268735 RepID=A0A3A6QE87_9EURY|nr:ISH6 family transposase [Halonotius pteroides]RJX51483.1 ISH6 family transposase [Halonotius pteroides]
MKESPTEISVTIDFVLTLDLSEKHPLAALADFLTEQHLESTLLEAMVESLNEHLVEAYCGEKHAQGNGTKRYQRSTSKTRTAVTTAGDHQFSLGYVKDTAAADDESTYFRPIDNVIDFNGQKRYQQDIAARTVDLATTLSYRDAVAHADELERTPSKDTIRDRVTDCGRKLTEFVSSRIAGREAETVIPDGTNCYSQDEDREYHNVRVTLAEDTEAAARSVLDVSVNSPWSEIADSLDAAEAITDDAKVVSDAENSLVKAFKTNTRDHQLDLSHVPRTLGYKLWDDGALSLEDRKEIISEVAGELFHLKNSVEKHRPEDEYSAIRGRIAQTKDRIEKTAWQLDQLSSPKAASYLRGELDSMVTFAEEATAGFEVPWTSNPVERAMGEVAKRCKRDWMQWSEEGLDTLLQLTLTKYANPDYYRKFFDEFLQRSTQNKMRCSVSVTANGGKV